MFTCNGRGDTAVNNSDYGEGEWKVCQHGYSKRRMWRKVHLGPDASTGQVPAALTHQDVANDDVLAELLDKIRTTSSSMLLTTTGPTIPSRATLPLPRAAQYVLPDAITMGGHFALTLDSCNPTIYARFRLRSGDQACR